MSKEPKFEVEGTTTVSGQGALVFARVIGNDEFRVKAGLRLNGAIIKGGYIPRKLDKNGNPRIDVWGFWLENVDDLKRFQEGDMVELSQK